MTRLAGATGRNKGEAYPGGGAGSAGGGSGKVKVNAVDALADYLEVKVIPGSNVTVTPVDLGSGVLALSIAASVPPGSSDHKVLVDGADTTAGFLGAKIVAGAAIALAVLSPGGDEQISVAVNDLRNAQVAADAAIAGTKISPNFGSQAVSTTGALSAGTTTVTSLTATALGLGVVHSSAGGVFTSSLIVNADVSGVANIAGTKIDPDFGSQNIITLGTLSAGAATFSGVTVSSFITGVIHSDAGGSLSSSLIVNADVATAAAIAVTKLAPGSNGEVLQTSGGSATWALLPAGSLAPGAANTVLVTNGAASATTFALLVNANVDSAAAIAGSKIDPTFGAQTVSTTTEIDINTATPILRLGTTAGADQAATVGQIRVNTTFTLVGWSGAVNRVLLDWSGTNLRVGSNSLANINLASTTAGQMQLGATIVAQWQSGGILINTGGLIFTGGSDSRVKPADATAVNGLSLMVRGGDTSLAVGGPVDGGVLNLKGGDASGSAGGVTFKGGKVNVLGGDSTGGAGTRSGGDVLIAPGGVGGVGPYGNVAFHNDPISYQTMQKGIFIGNSNAAPAGNPTAGYFIYATAVGVFILGPAGTLTPVALA